MASSKFQSYPPPETPASWAPYSTRPVLPAHSPPAHLLLSKPALPTPQRQPAFSGSASLNYTLSTHLIPSCYLRTTPYIPEYQTLGSKTTKQERQEWAKSVNDRFKKRAKEDGKTGFEQPAVLWNCLNRYVRKGLDRSGSGVTLFFAHATGFPKEIWEPTINHLLNSPSGPIIDEIWTWEAIQHGDACLVNKDTLGCNFDWTDNSRDILNFLLHFLPSSPSPSSLPTHLSQIPALETTHRKSHGFKHRQLLCIGHSFGGCSTTLAALTYPSLFSSLILVDPIIVNPPSGPVTQASAQQHVNALVLGALVRRDSWPSKEAAIEALSKSPFFGAWNKDALRAYVEGGTYVADSEGDGQGQARLKTSGLQEAVVFAENHTRAEVYAQVPELDERIKLRWVMPGTPGAPGAEEFGPPGAARERVWLRPKNAGNVRVMGAGHLIPQEKPELLAEYLAGFIEENYRTLDAPKAML